MLLNTKRLWYALWEKCMLDNYLGMSYGSAGPEFNVNELIIYTKWGVFKAETDLKCFKVSGKEFKMAPQR